MRVARGLSPGAARIVDDDHGRLDENGREFQRIYFWRNILRTLEEIRETLNRLNKEAAFRDAMSRREPEVREAFTRLKRTLNKTSQDVLAKLRNQLGGHLDWDAMAEALRELEPDTEGFLEQATARWPTASALRFAVDLVWAMFARHVKVGQRTVDALLGNTADLIPTVEAIDHVVGCYLRERGLVRGR